MSIRGLVAATRALSGVRPSAKAFGNGSSRTYTAGIGVPALSDRSFTMPYRRDSSDADTFPPPKLFSILSTGTL